MGILNRLLYKKRFERFIDVEDSDDMICEKCGKQCGIGSGVSFSPIGEGKVRCSNCWDWL